MLFACGENSDDHTPGTVGVPWQPAEAAWGELACWQLDWPANDGHKRTVPIKRHSNEQTASSVRHPYTTTRKPRGKPRHLISTRCQYIAKTISQHQSKFGEQQWKSKLTGPKVTLVVVSNGNTNFVDMRTAKFIEHQVSLLGSSGLVS